MRTANPSIAELRAVCQPPELIARYSAEHWAGRLYGRKVSIYLTWLFVRARVRANTVTLAMALVGIAGAAYFAAGGIVGPLLGVVLIQLYLVLDCSDGELARWQASTGATGIYLDRLGHYLVEATLFVALGGRALRSTGFQADLWFMVGLWAALFHVLGKVQTDLVHVARAKAGLRPAPDDEATSVPSGRLGAARRAARVLPLYRLTGAVEASLVSFVVIAVGRTSDRPHLWDQGLAAGFMALTALVALGHLVMIVASNRLR